MATETTSTTSGRTSLYALLWCLLALATVVAVLGVTASLVLVSLAAEVEALDIMTVLWAVAIATAGCCVAAGLCALAWLARAQQRQAVLAGQVASALDRLAAGGRAVVRRPAAAPAGEEGVTIASEVPEAIGADPLLEELRELNVNVLLSESQRQAKRRYLIEREGQRLAEQIERALSAGDVDAARERLDRFVRLFPDDPRIEPLGRRIERARAEAEARDVGEARKRIENLMSVGDFAGAEAVANGLLARHPACADAVALLARVRREREAFVREQRLALYQRVEKEAAGRHWRGALSAAEELVAGHPGSPECDAVGAQLETLRENARMEEARQLRDRIRELIEGKRFAEAADAARDLIARFPDTAAAGELRQQMPRLAELAATGGEAPA